MSPATFETCKCAFVSMPNDIKEKEAALLCGGLAYFSSMLVEFLEVYGTISLRVSLLSAVPLALMNGALLTAAPGLLLFSRLSRLR